MAVQDSFPEPDDRGCCLHQHLLSGAEDGWQDETRLLVNTAEFIGPVWSVTRSSFVDACVLPHEEELYKAFLLFGSF
jgi:hypothetical protein